MLTTLCCDRCSLGAAALTVNPVVNSFRQIVQARYMYGGFHFSLFCPFFLSLP